MACRQVGDGSEKEADGKPVHLQPAAGDSSHLDYPGYLLVLVQLVLGFCTDPANITTMIKTFTEYLVLTFRLN